MAAMLRISAPLGLFALACGFDSSGLGGGRGALGESTTSSASDAASGLDSAMSASTTATSRGTDGNTTGSSGPLTTAGEHTTDTGCIPGEIQCVCDVEACDTGLVCTDGLCIAPECGDSFVQAGEDCDDGNDIDDDGCDRGCRHSTGAATVALGAEHTCATLHDGRVRCWGNGGSGRTGQQTTANLGDDEPASAGIDVNVGAAVATLGLGTEHTCALTRAGTVRCWGSAAGGRLGYASAVAQPLGDDEAAGSGGDVNLGGLARSLAVGAEHACALLIDRVSVRCWGVGSRGRLGYGNLADVGSLEDPADVGPVDLGGAEVRKVVAASTHTCALLSGGDVRCWGDARAGRLGLPGSGDLGDDETPSTAPTLELGGVARDLSCGADHCCVLREDASVRCWGEGGSGRLGTGSNDDVGDTEHPFEGVVDAGGSVAQVVAGAAHTCILLEDNSVRCFGEGDHGRLGYGSTTDFGGNAKTIPALLPAVELNDPGVRVLGLAAGGAHTCARFAGGTLRCWGRANKGQLGYGNSMSVGDNAGEFPAGAGDVPFI